jgi:polyamine oxidase
VAGGHDHDGYHDGRTDVPGGLTEPVDRVVVVGAGIAGLTVANALAHAGVECIVMEARSRVGGRLHTVDLAGSPVDMGASWIHQPIGNPLRDLAEQLGVPCRAANPLPDMAVFDCAEQRRLSTAEVTASLTMMFETFPGAVERLRVELGPDASAAEAIESYVTREGWTPAESRRARQGLRGVIEADAADRAERQSLRWLGNEIDYGGDYLGDIPVGGYRRLVDALATGVDVRLAVEVTDVTVTRGGVRVRTGDGGAQDGSHVVVTVPLGVLQRGRPQFSPALPPDRVAAIRRLGFGRYEKVVVRFDRPFWRDAGFSHLMLFPRDPVQPMHFVIDQSAFDAGAVLVCHVFHSATDHVIEATQDEACQWFLGVLSAAVGHPCPAPSAVTVSSWSTEVHSEGAYSHLPPGAGPDDLDLLGEPIHGRLLFAGEHTQSARMGFADGAMSSGIREAKRLLARPAVHLGRIAAAS